MNYSLIDKVSLRLPIKTLYLISIIYAGWLFLGAAPELLIYDRVLIQQGEIWRLITAHFVHVDFEHLILNLSALFLLGFIQEQLNQRLFIPAIVIGVLSVTTGIWFGLNSLLYYCGLSGVLNSLLTITLWQLWLKSKDPIILLLAAANLVKIFVEIETGNALFSSIAWPPLPQAHLFGIVGGISFLLVMLLCNSKNRQNPIYD